MRLAIQIAFRYLFGKKSTNAINVISGISAVAMCTGAAALIIILSVFNGLEGLVKSLYKSFDPDIKVIAVEGKSFQADSTMILELRQLDGVLAVSQVLEDLALSRYGDKTEPCKIKAVDTSFLSVVKMDSAVIRGEFQLKIGERHYAVLGRGVERNLDVNIYSNFQDLQLYVPRRSKGRKLVPSESFNLRTIEPGGTFSIQEEFDREHVFVDLAFGQDLFGYKNGEISSLEIRIDPNLDPLVVQEQIANIAGPSFNVKNREQQNQFLYQVIRTEKWAVYAILCLILIVASFNIIGALSMLVMEKTKDIAILRAMGGSSQLIRRIFLFEGLLLSLLGGIIGMAIAFVMCYLQQRFGIVPIGGESLLVEYFPVEMYWGDFVLSFLTIVVITLLASYFPARKAAQQKAQLRTAA